MNQNQHEFRVVTPLAVGVFYLLQRRACVDFPGTSPTAPSLWVSLSLGPNSLLRDGDQVYFPMRIPWYIWQYVVVPILTNTQPQRYPDSIDAKYDLGLETRLALTRVGGTHPDEYDSILLVINTLLGQIMEDQGIYPPGTIT